MNESAERNAQNGGPPMTMKDLQDKHNRDGTRLLILSENTDRNPHSGNDKSPTFRQAESPPNRTPINMMKNANTKTGPDSPARVPQKPGNSLMQSKKKPLVPSNIFKVKGVASKMHNQHAPPNPPPAPPAKSNDKYTLDVKSKALDEITATQRSNPSKPQPMYQHNRNIEGASIGDETDGTAYGSAKDRRDEQGRGLINTPMGHLANLTQ